MNIEKMTVEEIEALGYREMVKFESARNNLQVIQQELQKRAQTIESTSDPMAMINDKEL